MKNLTNCSNKELSLIMFNNQSLYSGMMDILNSHTEQKSPGINTHDLLKDFIDSQGYKYTDEQWELFKSDVITHYISIYK